LENVVCSPSTTYLYRCEDDADFLAKEVKKLRNLIFEEMYTDATFVVVHQAFKTNIVLFFVYKLFRKRFQKEQKHV
jgi:hypothetical protein